ncbi:hypothetical protein HK100_006278, partial [Physocladia obscura]
ENAAARTGALCCVVNQDTNRGTSRDAGLECFRDEFTSNVEGGGCNIGPLCIGGSSGALSVVIEVAVG